MRDADCGNGYYCACSNPGCLVVSDYSTVAGDPEGQCLSAKDVANTIVPVRLTDGGIWRRTYGED